MKSNRPPIVVILGHVDHGKTSLLDALHKTNVTAREIGGITQSTRAFQVSGITFIDTPGHAAFSQMRARGGKIADIAILVVAANDGVMPQTIESIQTIKSAGIPMIVAFNKIDLPEAQIDRVKGQLAEKGVIVESFGGEVPSIEISAKNGKGLPELLEMIDLINQLSPAQADPDGDLEAIVLESSLDPKKGPVATVIVKNGTLSESQSLPVGKVKALTNSEGERIKSALPSMPVEILGLEKVPAVGSIISTTPELRSSPPKVGGDKRGGTGHMNIILRADVLGSLEAILASLDPSIDVILNGTGDISESDVLLSQSAGAAIIGFNVKISNSVTKLAETEKIQLRNYKIIYELLDAVEKLLHPDSLETIMGKANILAEFKYENLRVAGCKCTEGEIKKADFVRVMRGTTIVGESRFKSLRLGKAETTIIRKDQEFGAILVPYLDFKVGDGIIAYQTHGSI